MIDEQVIEPITQEELPIPRNQKAVLLASVVGFLILGLGGGILLFKKNTSTLEKVDQVVDQVQTQTANVLTSPSPTPFSFQEMTIPYLRQRSYTSQLGPQEKIGETSTYTSYLTSYTSDGLKVNGLLTQPKGEQPIGGFPAIVFIHGYIPPARYQTRTQYEAYVDYLARNGFVVFKIDLRGHGQSEGEAGGGYYSSDYIVDALNARAALQASNFVNKDKVGMWGHSMAGNITMRALASQPEIPAIAIWGGAVYTYEDMQEYGIDDNSYQAPSSTSPSRQKRQQLFDTHGQFNPESAFWKQVPATNYLNEIKGAVGLFHAVNDDVVSVEYSRGLKIKLDASNIPNELNEYPNGGHNISGTAFSQAMRDTVDFFNQHLQ